MIDELLFYLPGTADNLLFLTLAVLIVLMLTGVYGYLNAVVHQRHETGFRWGWPLLSVCALLILLVWFGEPFTAKSEGSLKAMLQQFSPLIAGTLVIVSGAAAVLTSDLKWARGAMAVSLLSSGLLFLQAEMVPLILLCWLILGGVVLLYLNQGLSTPGETSDQSEEETPFREPFLSCLACGFLLCVCLWIVQREWGPGREQTVEVSDSSPAEKTLPELLPELFDQYWPTLMIILILIAFVFVGLTRLVYTAPSAERTRPEETGGLP